MNLSYPIKLLYRKMTSVYWQVAFLNHNLPIVQEKKVSVLRFQNQEKNWFADPFIFDIRDNEIDVIAEEYITNIKKGVITLLTSRKTDNVVLSKKRIIELDTHLSFPFIFRENGKTYMFPENSASGSHFAYELDTNLNATKVTEVVSDPLTDTAIVKIADSYYLFGTRIPEENGNIVRIYKSSKLTGKYELYQEISVNKATARGASGIYSLSMPYHYYRIGQDNEGFYGDGLVFQEIEFHADSKKFTIKEKYRKYPDFDDKGYVAMHTYNAMGDIAVIDVKKYKYPILGRMINYLRYRK